MLECRFEGKEEKLASYIIYQADVTDPEQYEKYKERVAPCISAAGGRYLVRGGSIEVLEGDPPLPRIVILEFPSKEAALEWYHGEEYQMIRRLRIGAANAHGYLAEGLS